MAIHNEGDVAQKIPELLIRQHAPETQASRDGALLARVPTVDDILNEHATPLRDDFLGYRNYVYRILNLCVAIVGRSELDKIAAAAAKHGGTVRIPERSSFPPRVSEPEPCGVDTNV